MGYRLRRVHLGAQACKKSQGADLWLGLELECLVAICLVLPWRWRGHLGHLRRDEQHHGFEDGHLSGLHEVIQEQVGSSVCQNLSVHCFFECDAHTGFRARQAFGHSNAENALLEIHQHPGDLVKSCGCTKRFNLNGHIDQLLN